MSRDIPQSSRWTLPPTPRQCAALFRYGVKHEELPTTRWEARRLIYELRKKKEKDASKE